MSQLEQKLIELEAKIYSAPIELRAVYAVKIGLQEMLRAAEAPAIQHLMHQGEHSRLDARSVADNFESLWARGGGSEIVALAKIHAAVATIERHPRHAEAVGFFEPLLAERDRLTATIERERREIEAARQAAEDAHRLAQERARLAAANDPAVLAAAAELQRLENPTATPPAKPFRGRVAVGSPD